MKLFPLLFAAFLSLLLNGCDRNASPNTLKVAATSVPHAEILEKIKPDLKQQGIDLQIVVVDDFNTPNRALADKEVDANFFQHPAFLEQQTKDFGYSLEVLGAVHLEPMGIYSRRVKSLKELKENSVIAIPSDPSNEARALELIEKSGLISLNKHHSLPSVLDITNNPHRLKFVEIDPPLLARALEDVDAAAITTNFALQSGLVPQKDALALEDAHSDFVNVLVIRKGDSTRADLQALLQALRSENVRSFLETQYKGAIIPAF